MKELIGGLWLAGLLAWAILGPIPGIILLLLGIAAGSCELVRQAAITRAAANWRRNYPPYGY